MKVLKQKSALKQIWLQSQTVFLAKVQAVSAAGLLTVSQISGMFNDPTVKEYLGELKMPVWFPIFLLVLAGVTYLAHGHKDD